MFFAVPWPPSLIQNVRLYDDHFFIEDVPVFLSSSSDHM